jgi:hypothetical protein
MSLHHVLTLTDHGAAAERGVERAAELAARHQARLHLFAPLAPAGEAWRHHPDRLGMRARQLARRHGIDVLPQPLHTLGQALATPAGGAREAAGRLLVLHAGLLRAWPWRTRAVWAGACPVWLPGESGPAAAPATLVVDTGRVPAERLQAWAGQVSAPGRLERLCLPERAGEVYVWPPPAPGPTAGLGWRERDHLSSRRNRVDHRRGRLDEVRLIARQAERSRASLVLLCSGAEPPWRQLLGGPLPRRLQPALSADLLWLPEALLLASAAQARRRVAAVLWPHGDTPSAQGAGGLA